MIDAFSLLCCRNGIDGRIDFFVGIFFPQNIQILKALAVRGRHDISSFAVFVPGGNPYGVIAPVPGSNRRKIGALDPVMNRAVILFGDKRIAPARPRHMVKADRNGRNCVDIAAVMTGDDIADIDLRIVAGRAPAVCKGRLILERIRLRFL